jgi:hypothetical protein
VVGGSNVRESFRLGDVRLVTADAQNGGVESGGLDRARVICVFRQRPVAGLTIDVHMPAAFLFLQDVGVTVFASLVAGIVHGAGGDLRDGISAVVSILSKALWHKKRAHSHKRQAADDENRSQPKQVLRIFEGIHKRTALLDTGV